METKNVKEVNDEKKEATKKVVKQRRGFRKGYTEAQTEEIYNLWYVKQGTPKQKKALSIRLKRTVTSLAQKAYKMHKDIENSAVVLRKPLPEVPIGKVQVTHVNKIPNTEERATITIDGVKVVVPSNTFTINGVKIGW